MSRPFQKVSETGNGAQHAVYIVVIGIEAGEIEVHRPCESLIDREGSYRKAQEGQAVKPRSRLWKSGGLEEEKRGR